MKDVFSFRSLDFMDVPLVHRWFNLPHVQRFYSLRQWTEQEVVGKLEPYITGKQPVTGFIAMMNDIPIGYVQKYKVSDYPWPTLDLPGQIASNAAGMDLFIGDETLIGMGVGGKLIRSFLDEHIWPYFQYCIVDPDINNVAAIRCYENLHFQELVIIDSKDAVDNTVTLKLMILEQ